MIQLYLGIHCQKYGQYIGKTKTSENTSTYGCTVAELYTDNMADTFTDGSVCICGKSRMFFYLTQCCHGTDDKLCIRLGDLIQPKP